MELITSHNIELLLILPLAKGIRIELGTMMLLWQLMLQHSGGLRCHHSKTGNVISKYIEYQILRILLGELLVIILKENLLNMLTKTVFFIIRQHGAWETVGAGKQFGGQRIRIRHIAPLFTIMSVASLNLAQLSNRFVVQFHNLTGRQQALVTLHHHLVTNRLAIVLNQIFSDRRCCVEGFSLMLFTFPQAHKPTLEQIATGRF